MRAEHKTKITETVVVVEVGDILKTAQLASLWPKGGKVAEWWWDDEQQEFRIRVQAPEITPKVPGSFVDDSTPEERGSDGFA